MNKPDPSFPSLGAVVSHAARLLTQALAESQKSLSLAPAQYRVLVELWQQDQLTQHMLVQRLDIEQSTVGNTLNRMERDGLIRRQPHAQDGRSRIICLTPLAKKLKPAAMNASSQINEAVLSEFSEAEKAQLFEYMGRIIQKLKPPTSNPSA